MTFIAFIALSKFLAVKSHSIEVKIYTKYDSENTATLGIAGVNANEFLTHKRAFQSVRVNLFPPTVK